MQSLSKFKQTELGEIPIEWSVIRIQDICKTSSGGTPSRSNPSFYKGNIPWVKTGELKDGYIYQTEESISEDALRSSSAKLFPPETVLFAMYGATIGKTAITKIPAATNQACCAFLPIKNDTVHPYFLQQYFIHVRPKIASKGEGAGQPNTSQDFLRVFRILYPPFKEQHKIALILSKIDELIQKTDQIIEQTQRLKKGLMQRLLTKGIGKKTFKSVSFGPSFLNYDIPDTWQVLTLKECVRSDVLITYGIVQAGPHIPSGVPYIRTGDMSRGKLSKDDLLCTSKEIASGFRRSQVKAGEIVCALRGIVGTRL